MAGLRKLAAPGVAVAVVVAVLAAIWLPAGAAPGRGPWPTHWPRGWVLTHQAPPTAVSVGGGVRVRSAENGTQTELLRYGAARHSHVIAHALVPAHGPVIGSTIDRDGTIAVVARDGHRGIWDLTWTRGQAPSPWTELVGTLQPRHQYGGVMSGTSTDPAGDMLAFGWTDSFEWDYAVYQPGSGWGRTHSFPVRTSTEWIQDMTLTRDGELVGYGNTVDAGDLTLGLTAWRSSTDDSWTAEKVTTAGSVHDGRLSAGPEESVAAEVVDAHPGKTSLEVYSATTEPASKQLPIAWYAACVQSLGPGSARFVAVDTNAPYRARFLTYDGRWHVVRTIAFGRNAEVTACRARPGGGLVLTWSAEPVTFPTRTLSWRVGHLPSRVTSLGTARIAPQSTGLLRGNGEWVRLGARAHGTSRTAYAVRYPGLVHGRNGAMAGVGRPSLNAR